jgi:O-acetyl-ADP-ribose deacetylase (regulator of RNase III)
MSINYVTGDATDPQGPGLKIIAHGCNDRGGWGSGFVLAVSRRWELPEQKYRAWAASGHKFRAGNIQIVKPEEDIWVANMITQNGTVGPSNPKPVNYEALLECFQKLAQVCRKNHESNPSIHMPRVGCGLARGDWNVVEALVKSALVEDEIPVTVYDLP